MDARVQVIEEHWDAEVVPRVRTFADPATGSVAKIGRYLVNPRAMMRPGDVEVAGWQKWIDTLERELPPIGDLSAETVREALQAARALLREWFPDAQQKAE